MDFKDKLNIFNKANKGDNNNIDNYNIKKKNDNKVSKK
jgi:hypothetical protein